MVCYLDFSLFTFRFSLFFVTLCQFFNHKLKPNNNEHKTKTLHPYGERDSNTVV